MPPATRASPRSRGLGPWAPEAPPHGTPSPLPGCGPAAAAQQRLRWTRHGGQAGGGYVGAAGPALPSCPGRAARPHNTRLPSAQGRALLGISDWPRAMLLTQAWPSCAPSPCGCKAAQPNSGRRHRGPRRRGLTECGRQPVPAWATLAARPAFRWMLKLPACPFGQCSTAAPTMCCAAWPRAPLTACACTAAPAACCTSNCAAGACALPVGPLQPPRLLPHMPVPLLRPRFGHP